MIGAHVIQDHLILAAFFVLTLVEWLWYWPRCVAAIAAGVPGARARVYRNLLAVEWVLAGCILALWAARGRPWATLGLGRGTAIRLGLGLALAAVYLGLAWAQRRALLARPERLARLRQKLNYADPLLPHTSAEHRMFILVALTAGICEELFFRGYVMWYFGVWTGSLGAAAISSIIFGLGHIYLGLEQVPRTAAVGAVLAVIVLAAGSLWPAIIIHAAMDLLAGDLGYRALAQASPAGSAPAPAGVS